MLTFPLVRYSISFSGLFLQKAKTCSQDSLSVFRLNRVCLFCLVLTSGYIPIRDWLPGAYSLKIWVGGKCQVFSSLCMWCLWFFVSLYSYHFHKKLWTMGWSSVFLFSSFFVVMLLKISMYLAENKVWFASYFNSCWKTEVEVAFWLPSSVLT